jgi:hypothetical protein
MKIWRCCTLNWNSNLVVRLCSYLYYSYIYTLLSSRNSELVGILWDNHGYLFSSCTFHWNLASLAEQSSYCNQSKIKHWLRYAIRSPWLAGSPR